MDPVSELTVTINASPGINPCADAKLTSVVANAANAINVGLGIAPVSCSDIVTVAYVTVVSPATAVPTILKSAIDPSVVTSVIVTTPSLAVVAPPKFVPNILILLPT